MYALRSKLCSVFFLSCMPISAFAFELFADLLIWQPSEEPSLLWASSLSSPSNNLEVFEGNTLTFDWDLGFRVGGGDVFGCDCWDLQVYYTWFQGNASRALPKKSELIETQFFGGFLNRDLSESARIRLKLKYNMFDGQLGRDFCVSHFLSLKPYIGLKGGWIDQSIHSQWVNIDLQTLTLFSATEDLTNDFWGIGPSAGVNSKWAFGNCFHLFGDFETAFLWGTWENTDVYKNTQSVVINTNMENVCLGSLTLRLFAGLGWERDICNWAHLAIRFGYEAQIWFNQLRIPTFQQLRVHGDLTLQGGTLNVNFEF